MPSCGDGIQGPRQHKDKSAIGHACQTTALQGAGADAVKGDHTEQLTKSVDGFVQQRFNGFWCPISTGQACPAAGDHHVNGWVSDPSAEFRPDLIAIVRTECTLMELMASVCDAALQLIAAAVLVESACVGNGEQGNREAHGTAAVTSDARTSSAATAVVLHVLLFASLRERVGWAERSLPLSSEVTTAREVWHQLDLGSLQGITVAVNQELVELDQPLKSGDELAFLPPFTGG